MGAGGSACEPRCGYSRWRIEPLKHDLDQIGAGCSDAFREPAIELVHITHPRAGDPHAFGHGHEIEIGSIEIEHIERLATGIAGADIGEFAL